jgi:hypothetical protein
LLQKQIAELREEKRSEIGDLQNENQKLRKKFALLKSQNEALCQENAGLRQALSEMKDSLNSVQKDLSIRAKRRDGKHSKLLQRSIMYSFLEKLKIFLNVKGQNLNSISKIYQDISNCDESEKGTKMKNWNVFLKRCGIKEEDVLSLDQFLDQSRKAGFKPEHPICVHPDCTDEGSCSSNQKEIEIFLRTTVHNQWALSSALSTLDALSVLVGLIGGENRPLLGLSGSTNVQQLFE